MYPLSLVKPMRKQKGDQMSFWFRFALGIVMTGFQATVKNPKSREDMRQAAKDVFDTIILAYPELLPK